MSVDLPLQCLWCQGLDLTPERSLLFLKSDEMKRRYLNWLFSALSSAFYFVWIELVSSQLEYPNNSAQYCKQSFIARSFGITPSALLAIIIARFCLRLERASLLSKHLGKSARIGSFHA